MSHFHTTREFPASPAQVFAALEEPSRLARWWGPNGFANAFDTFEFKPGGHWVFRMIGPDGREYRNACVFAAIEPERRLVIQHVSTPKYVLTLTCEQTEHGTRVGWDQTFDDPKVADAIRSLAESAMHQNLERLAIELARSEGLRS